MNLKPHFSRFLEADPDRLHFAAHSHHLWPDVTLEAQERCWRDAARLADRKWEMIFGELYPETQRQVAAVLRLPEPATLAFGANTHAFLLRLLSCLDPRHPPKVLTTDSEFHSFERQMSRLEEDGLAEVTRVAAEPFDSLTERLVEAASRGGYDLFYLSHVFYNSGYALPDLAAAVRAVPDEKALIVLDGYHGFMALDTDLSELADRVFYTSGGYKYAMAGEGVCFLHCPAGYGTRPRNTGWFAAFDALAEGPEARTAYGTGANRFLGATFDPVGLYRQNAVLSWLDSLGVTIADIHDHVCGLQRAFIDGLEQLALEDLRPNDLVVPLEEPNRGNFLTFRTESAGDLHRRLLAAKIVTDFRGDRLRFGFGLYQTGEDVDRLLARLAKFA